jgi:hypothetical protein
MKVVKISGPDPADPQSYNRYAYVRNNPLRYTDPTGHYCYDRSAGPDLVGTCVNENPYITVGNRYATKLGEAYQYQGPRGENNCGPANLAMLAELQLHDLGIETRVNGNQMGDAMQAASRFFGIAGYRLTNWVFKPFQGATPPWGMVMAYNQLGAELEAAGLPGLGESTWRTGATKDELIRNIENGVFSTIILVWDDGGAHYATVVGYQPSTDRFLLLDPGTGGDRSELHPWLRIFIEDWSWLDEHWSRRPWWLLWQNRAIVETQEPPGQPDR